MNGKVNPSVTVSPPNVLACANKAEIKTAESVEACNLKFYNILLCNSRRQYLVEYDILSGKTINGRLMTEENAIKS